jgi:transposase
LSHLKRLGIDEIALRKGHGHYIVVLVDIDCRVPIGLVCSRKHEDIKKVFDSWGLETLKQIEEVSIDMSGSYRGLIEEVLPDASIVADRFHVMKLVGDEFNSAIIQAKRTNEAMPESEEKEIVKQALKGSKYALLKPECNLTEKQKIKLSEVIEACPKLAAMHHQKEAFRNIFEAENNWRTGLYEIVKWMNIAKVYFEKSVGTIHRWLVEIIGYFDHRTTSGAVEGINNRLKLIKRSGYGFRNFDNFSLRALICWHL